MDKARAMMAAEVAERRGAAVRDRRHDRGLLCPQLIAIIEKNKRDEIRIALDQFKGHHLVDVRVFADPYAREERVATKKGVSLAIAKLPELVAALQEAEREARAAGLLEDESEPASADQEQTILAAG